MCILHFILRITLASFVTIYVLLLSDCNSIKIKICICPVRLKNVDGFEFIDLEQDISPELTRLQ